MASKRRLQIVLVPHPLQGHLTPMLQLGAILHSRGFSIIVAHSKHNAPNPSNHPDFIFLALADILPDQNNLGDVVGFTKHLNDKCKPDFQDYLVEKTENKPDDDNHQIACIIHDPSMYFAADVAQMLKLPSIVLYTSNASCGLAYTYLPWLHTQGLLVMKQDQLVNARYLSYVWGVGLEVEHGMERGDIERTIKRLMVDDEGLEIRQGAAELKEKVEAAMKEGGTSWNSLNDLVDYILSQVPV